MPQAGKRMLFFQTPTVRCRRSLSGAERFRMKKRKLLVPLLLVSLLLAGIAGFAVWRSGDRGVAISGTATVERQALEASVSANGTLVARQARDVYFDTPVKVTGILADRDARVRKGDAVLAVDLADLETQLAQARLNRDSAELNLRRVRDIDAATSLDALRLAVSQAESVLASDRAVLERANADLERNRPLYETGALSQSEFQRLERAAQDARTRVGLSEISLSSARANLSSSQSTTRKTDEQRAFDISTQENLLQLQQLNVKTLEDRIARIREAAASPLDGVVTVMNAQAGGMLSTVQPAFRVSDLSALEVEAQVKEVEIRHIELGQSVEITGDGIDEAVRVTGVVSAIASTADVLRDSTGEETVVAVTVTIGDPPDGLRPGLSVTARIITDTRADVPVIRYAMLTETPEGDSAVFVVNGDTAVLTPIETGITSDLDIEVTKGLQGGETVILNPTQELADGARIRLTTDAGGGMFGGMRP